MSVESPIATKRLKAVWHDGSAHDVILQIGRPYPKGNSFRCPVLAYGLQQDYSPPDLAGYDEMQAITLALGFVRFLLEWHIKEGGQLFYPTPDDNTPYTLNDLPKDNAATAS